MSKSGRNTAKTSTAEIGWVKEQESRDVALGWSMEMLVGELVWPLVLGSALSFSRIRQASFGRFTIDRLMAILYRLGQQVEISVDVHPRKKQEPGAEGAMHP